MNCLKSSIAWMRIWSRNGLMVAKTVISRGQRPGSLFVPMHWNNQFARRGRVNDLLSAITDPWSGQPESKQVAVAIAPWRPAWQGELFCRQPVPLPASVHWRRRATSGVSHLSLAGEHHPQEWLTDWCRQQGWQMQTAQAGARWSLLAWHEGTLMLGWWSHRCEPEIDVGWIADAFRSPPQTPSQRHALLGGKKSGETAPAGRIVCSCFSIGERAISEAIARGCPEGHEIHWDKLVLATGSYPFVPPVPGHDLEGCFVYRTLDDLDRIAACASSAKRGVVIGGGLLGLEAANALRQLGLETHVVEFAPNLMAVQLDSQGAAMLREKIHDIGVGVHTSKTTQSIARCDDGLVLNFADGESLATDMVVFPAGIRPQDTLARGSGLTVGERGGIVIDNQCRTSDPQVLAIGECALWQNKIYGLVAPGYQMARAAAAMLAGEEASFSGADMSTKQKLLGIDVASFGDAQGRTPGSQSYQWTDGPGQIYKKIVVSQDGKTLLGGVLVGDASDYATYALDNLEPGSDANVLSRGILGDAGGEPIVISPLYKHRIRLRDGRPCDGGEPMVRAWPVRIENGTVWVGNQLLLARAEAS